MCNYVHRFPKISVHKNAHQKICSLSHYRGCFYFPNKHRGKTITLFRDVPFAIPRTWKCAVNNCKWNTVTTFRWPFERAPVIKNGLVLFVCVVNIICCRQLKGKLIIKLGVVWKNEIIGRKSAQAVARFGHDHKMTKRWKINVVLIGILSRNEWKMWWRCSVYFLMPKHHYNLWRIE